MMNMTKCIGKGNMRVFIETKANYASVSVYSYSTLIMWYEIDNGVANFDVFNKHYFSNTTTRHQGYASNIYVQLKTSADPIKFLSDFGVKDLVYMDVKERKYWNLI